MWRITKTFESNGTLIYRIEGKIADESLAVWVGEIRALKKVADRQIILDFSHVWSISTQAMNALIELMPDNLYVLNCPMGMRNMLYSAGLSGKMLE